MNPSISIIAFCIRLAAENQALRGAAAAGAMEQRVGRWSFRGGGDCQATGACFSPFERC